MPTLFIPADVPRHAHQQYQENYHAITKNSGRLMLFAADQKIEHLNTDFYGTGIHPDAAHPEHLFRIASQGTIGTFATHLGLIARYGAQYSDINYIIKLNAKTDLIAPQQHDPSSAQLWSVDELVQFKQTSGLTIRGVGYTIYLGSEHEDMMLSQAAQIIYQAHQHGLITIVWIYPRGRAIANDQEASLAAGAAGIANALGSDFVKIKAPHSTADLAIATQAAGNTGVICSGGKHKEPRAFLQELAEQLQHGARGCATGRNIFQKSLPQAIAMTKAISALVYENADVDTAWQIYQNFLSRC